MDGRDAIPHDAPDAAPHPGPDHACTPAETIFAGEGEVAGLCRRMDWSSTALPPPAEWPPSLKAAVSIVLGSAFPMVVLWGRELVQIYNDGYRALMGAKHPAGLGQGNRECWPEVWEINEPIYERVFRGESVAFQNRVYPLAPDGEVEERYLTLSYGPVRDESGAVGGVFVTVFDATGEVRAREERDRALAEAQTGRERLFEVFQLAPALVATVRGPDHVFQMANPPYLEFVGHRDLVGQPVREALPEVEGQGFIDLLDVVYRTGEPFVGSEVRVALQPPDGGPLRDRYLDFVYQPLRDPGGEVSGILVHGVDVTELVRARNQAEAQTVETETQAEELQSQAMQLEEAQVELEMANDELQTTNAELIVRTEDSERERAAAEALSARLEAVLQQMPSGVVLAEARSSRVLLANEQVARIWRRPGAGGAPDAGWGEADGFRPDGSRYSADEWPLARSLATGEVVLDEEIEIWRGDGTRGVIAVRSAPIRDRDGRVVAGIASFDDVSERKEREDERAFLAEAGQVLASSLDYRETLHTIARLAVPRVADWCAVDVMEDDRLQRLAIVHPDPAREELAREVERRWPPDPRADGGVPEVLRTGEPVLYPDISEELLRASAQDEEHFRILKEIGLRSAMIVPMVVRERTLGAITLIAAESNRVFGPGDLVLAEQLASRAAVAVDTARLFREGHVAQRNAEKAREEAEEANRAKSEFLAAMSHELRTPLNAIGGYADLLLMGIRGPLGEEQREDISRIRRSGQHLLTLINDILNYAKLEAGQIQFQIESVSMTHLLVELEEMVTPQVAARGLAYSASACDRQLRVRADGEKTRQILLNLVTNAVKFTEPGGRVEISCASHDGSVRIAVRDTGRGIAPEQLGLIFDPFVQVDRKLTTDGQQGVGLGLAISRDLAAGMGGALTVESEPGAGSTFTLVLPHDG